MLLWNTVAVLLPVPTHSYCGLDCNIGESRSGCPGLALLTAGSDNGLQCRTEVATELVAVRCTLIATYIGKFVVVSAILVGNQGDTGIARHGLATLGIVGLAHSRSFPARVGSLPLQTKGPM